mgnify:CR=1 FL=1
MSLRELPAVQLRLRLGQHDAHYAGNLVDGARMLQLFGDAATELLIRLDGNEGLFRAYESVEFLHPVYGGDYIEIEARILSVGKSSRKMEFIARKVIENMKPDDPDFKAASSGHVLNPPLVVCKAVGTCVTPIALQKGGP